MSALDKMVESTFFDDFPELVKEAREELAQLRDQIATLKKGIRLDGEFEVAFLDAYLDHFRTLREKAARVDKLETALKEAWMILIGLSLLSVNGLELLADQRQNINAWLDAYHQKEPAK